MSRSRELRKRVALLAEEFGGAYGLPFYKSLGEHPSVIFEPFEDGTRHGNFIDDSYSAILTNPEWRARLGKKHSRASALPEQKRANAHELDSSNSSDALLMNIFCYPDILGEEVALLFGRSALSEPEFGVAGKVPLLSGKNDATEIDMRLGDIIVEAKFTEPSFTSKRKERVEEYDALFEIFWAGQLPQDNNEYHAYQLLRNILAAFHHGYTFFLLCDARRPDLLDRYQEVCEVIRPRELRSRCRLLLWQDIASVVPDELGAFLSQKYGIQQPQSAS